MELSKKAGVFGRPRASADYKYSERDKTKGGVGGSWIQITNVGIITLQQINSATRIEREAAMSSSPFFQSAGRRDLLFWGKKKDQR